MIGGAEGQTLEWVRNGLVVAAEAVSRANARVLTVGPGDWIAVVVRDGDDPTLLGNPVYFRR